jgi:hypothetical protein
MVKLEYHHAVRHWISASVALSALLLVSLVFVSPGQAQTPAFVPSPTGAVRPFTGAVQPTTGAVRPPTSVTPGRAGMGASSSIAGSRNPFSGSRTGTDKDRDRDRDRNKDRRHHPDHNGAYGFVPYAVAIPYGPDDEGAPDNAESDNDADYQGGPTVFDRRGSGEESYIPPVENDLAPHSRQGSAQDSLANEAAQPQTVLVFKDGHKVEVGNYAILGDTLFDLTPGHPRRIAIASLDLDATRQQNDDRGVVFQLPASAQGS